MRFITTAVLLTLAICLITTRIALSGEDVHRLAMLGGQINARDSIALEKQVEQNPDDIASRTKLLGYYFIHSGENPDTRSARLRHVMWFIENAPESDILGLPYSQLNKILEPQRYNHAKQAWLKTIHEMPENLAVLRNASNFFLLQDRAVAEDCLLKGQTLDAKDPHWPASLGQLYSLGLPFLPSGQARKAAAEKAFQQYRLAYDLSDSMKANALLYNLAKTAFAAGLIDDAKKFATKMLKDDSVGWNRGNRIHHGNLILGQIALLDGNVDDAKSRLLLAGKTNGSPQLNSFGPNMSLAKALLEQGETDVVLAYFDLCKKFWSSPNRKLEQWIDDVKSNRTPQFGANLAY